MTKDEKLLKKYYKKEFKGQKSFEELTENEKQKLYNSFFYKAYLMTYYVNRTNITLWCSLVGLEQGRLKRSASKVRCLVTTLFYKPKLKPMYQIKDRFKKYYTETIRNEVGDKLFWKKNNVPFNVLTWVQPDKISVNAIELLNELMDKQVEFVSGKKVINAVTVEDIINVFNKNGIRVNFK